MEGVERGVQSHVLDALSKPQIKLVPQNRGESARSVRDLKYRVVAETSVLSKNVDQPKDGLDRTQQRVLRRRQRNLVDSLAELVIFRLFDRQYDAAVEVIAKRGNVLPAENHLEIHRVS